MKELKYLNQYFYKYRWRFLLGILFVAASNYFRVLQPQIVREALDLVIENVTLYQMFDGTESSVEFYGALGKILLYFGVLVLILALIMGVFMFGYRQTIIVMSRLVEHDMRKEVFDHYQKLDISFYKKNKIGDLMSRIVEDVNKVRMYLGPAVLYGINLVTLFVFVIYSMLNVSVELTLWCLVPLPILSLSIYYVSNLINKRSTVIQQQLATLTSTSQEVYSGIRVVKSYVQEQFMGNYFAEQAEDYKNKALSLARVDALFFPTMVILIGASTIITVYVGGLLVVNGSISAGNIAEFVIYVNMLTWPVTALGWITSIIQQASASQKRINEFLKTPTKIVNPTTAPKDFKGSVEFKNVSFDYPDTGIRALDKVSFKVNAGEKLAIIGKTGSGKTTIADLLVRMYDVSNGEILIDGENIQSLDLNNLRQKIGYVPQDVFLFSDTIAKNVQFGKPSATQSEVEQYTKYAAIHKEIAELPKGYETMVGERGVTLSGGQKQRVSIARAFIKNPDFVLLDDCLSAVDTKTEKTITGFLTDAMGDKTAIIITHRVYGLLNFDKIIVLEDGHIAEAGNHDELMQNGGYYADMYEKQMSEEVV